MPTKYLELETWLDMGFKGILFAIFAGVLLFGIIKNKIGFTTIGPSEAGIREFCGLRLWKLGPGLHPDVEGLWKVRKVSIAKKQIDIKGQSKNDGLVKDYEIAVLISVQNTKEALKDRIYRAEDNDKSNMDNSEAEKQVTAILKRNTRRLLEANLTPDLIESQLETDSLSGVGQYGYAIDEVQVCELVIRPLSEVAEAIKASDPNNPGAVSRAISGILPELTVHNGGSAQADAS